MMAQLNSAWVYDADKKVLIRTISFAAKPNLFKFTSTVFSLATNAAHDFYALEVTPRKKSVTIRLKTPSLGPNAVILRISSY